jgi:hypothetical protein
LKRFGEVFDVLSPGKKQQALRLIIRRLVVNRLPPGVTKSDTDSGKNGVTIQKAQFLVTLDLYVKPLFSNALKKEAGIFVFRSEMAAQGGAEDKILRVSMLFEKGGNLARKSRLVLPQKHLSFGNAADPSSVVLKVRFWAAQLRDGRVRSCAEIARKEGITSARVSQLWPLSRMTAKRIDDVLEASKDGRISLRQLLRIVRESETKRRVSQAENAATG